MLFVLFAGSEILKAAVTSESQAPGLSVRGLRLILEGNGLEVKSDALAKLDEAGGEIVYTLYVARTDDAPFEKLKGAEGFKITAKTPAAPDGTAGHRRTGKDTLLLVDREPLLWRDGDPWPEPRRYRIGEKRAGAAETLSAATDPHPVIMFGTEPDRTRIELPSLGDGDWMSIPVSFGCEDQHYDIPGAHFTVQAGPWTGHQWSSRMEGVKAFQPPGTSFAPAANGVALRFPGSLQEVTLNITAEGDGYSAKRSFTVVPPAPAAAERTSAVATSRQRHAASLESRRLAVDQVGANIAGMRERIKANANDSAMQAEVKRLQDSLAGAQLEYAVEKLTVSEKDPRGEAEIARQAMEWGPWFAAVERERTLELQTSDMGLQRWAGDPDRARLMREQNDTAILDVERRRATAAELAGIAGTFRTSCEEQLKILESKRDLTEPGKVLEIMAHGTALLTADRQAAADTLRRARTALLAGALEADRANLKKRFDDGPLPEWWPATAQPKVKSKLQVKPQQDPYWAWYPKFVKQVREKYAIVSSSKRNAGHLSLAIAKLQAQQWRLKAALEAGTGNGQFSDQIRARMQAVIEHARQSEGFFHNEVSRQEQEGLDALGFLAEELDKAAGQWRADHPDLEIWRDNTRELARRLPLELAEAAGDVERISTLLRDAGGWQSVSPYTTRWLRLVETRLNILRGDLLPALFTLRDMHREDPADSDVRRKLTEVEASLMRQGLAKAGGAIAEARANFNRYLSERGFGVGEKDTSWLSQQFGGLRDYDSETAWVIWSTGVVSWIPQALGRADDEDAKLAQKEVPLQNAYLGMQIMVRLGVRGLTLAEIRGLDAAAILKELPARTTAGKPWDLQDAAVFRRHIDAALTLEDVRKLAEDERDGLAAELKRSYWDPAEASSTWLEWVGDLTSPRNILSLWAPMLRVQHAGEAITVTQLINRKLGIEASLKWAGTTAWGERVAAVLIESADTRKQHAVKWAIGKFVALSGFQAAVSCLGKQFAGKYGEIATDGLFVLAGDPDALAGWLKEAKAAKNVTEAMLEATQKAAAARQEALAKLEAARNEMISALREMEASPNMTLDPALDAKLKSMLGPEWLKGPLDNLPTGDSDDVVRALVESIQSGRQRTSTGAREALEELGATIDAEATILAETIVATQTVRNALARGAPTAAETLECFLPLAVEKWLRAFGSRNPWVVPKDCRTAQAFGFLHGGKPAEAAAAFLALAREAESGIKGASPLPSQVLHWLSEMADGVAKLPARPLRDGLDATITAPISPEVADALLAKAQSATWTKRDVSSITFLEEGGQKFAVKKISEHTQQVSLLVRAAEGETMHMGLCYALGINTPAVATRPHIAADGKLEMYIMTRFVQGEELAEMAASRMFQFSEDLSAHRGLALILGDYDRKAGNYLVSSGGALCAMDAASADIRGNMAKVMFSTSEKPVGVDHKEVMEGVWNLGHWLRRCRNSFDKHGAEMLPDVKATLMAELSLTSGPARKTVNRLRNLTPEHLEPMLHLAHQPFDNATPELRAAYAALNGPEGFDAAKAAAEMLDDMKKRMGRADEALSTLHARNGLPEFNPNDLVYGLTFAPAAGSELAGTVTRFGGQTLQDYGPKNGFTSSGEGAWTEYSLQILNEWAAKNDGRKIRFDLTHMEGIDDILAGKGSRVDAVTSQELRHIQRNWERFKDCVKFYRGGIEVPPPWAQ